MRKALAVVLLLFAAVPLSAANALQRELARILAQFAEGRSDAELARLIAYYDSAEGKRALAAAMAALNEQALRATPATPADMANRLKLRRTMEDMRSFATVLEARATDENEYPREGTVATLEPLLSPTYIRVLPRQDGWGHDFVYVGSADGMHYRLISGGADGIIDPESRTFTPADGDSVRYSHRPEDDIIFADGAFIQAPHDWRQQLQ